MNDIARAFNAWMQDYVDHPEKFEREWKSVGQFLTEKTGGKEPSYGEICAVVLERYRQIEPSRCATITFGGGHIGLPAGGTYVINLDPNSREYLLYTEATALADAAVDFRRATQRFGSMHPGGMKENPPAKPPENTER